MDEIHAEALTWPVRSRRLAAMQTHVLATTAPHPQLQAVQPIDPSDALEIHWPPFATKHHVDALEAEAVARSGDLANAVA